MKVGAKVLLFCEICKFFFSIRPELCILKQKTALGIGRATVLCINAERVNPCKARPRRNAHARPKEHALLNLLFHLSPQIDNLREPQGVRGKLRLEGPPTSGCAGWYRKRKTSFAGVFLYVLHDKATAASDLCQPKDGSGVA